MCRCRKSNPKHVEKCCFTVLFLLFCSKLVQGNVEITNNSHVNDTESRPKVITPHSFQSTDSTTNQLDDVQGVELCTCDLTVNLCDINCCCDESCTTDDKKQFSACRDYITLMDENLCERPYVVVNGTNLQKGTVISPSDLCIWKDNYEERHFFPDIKGATTLEEFEKMVSEVSSFADFASQDDIVVDTKQHSDLIYVNSSFKTVLGVPYPLVGHRCNSYLPVQYAQSEEFKCFQVVQLSAECATNYSALSALSYYYGMDIPAATEHAITVELCNENLKNCTCVEELPRPSYDDTEHLCRNVVSCLEYVIIHNGVTGGKKSISKVTARISLRDVYAEKENEVSWLKQKFKITFEWGGNKNKLLLSGNPGYVMGYPVLAGTVKDGVVNFINDQWLSVHLSDQSSECVELVSTPVVFGENVISSCSVTVSGDSRLSACSRLRQILAMILNNIPSHIGAYGNSSPNKTGDWVPVLRPREDSINYFQRSSLVSQDGKCAGVMRALNIELTYVYVGFADNRQAKIIGALLQSRSSDVRPVFDSYSQNSGWTLSTDVTVSVMFVDVTTPPTAIFAPFPTFDIRLPNDFFNPFV